MRARKKNAGHVSHERWLVSYADFITLLFAFFTTMYAISTVDSRKLNAMVESMQSAFARGESLEKPHQLGAPRPSPAPGPAAAKAPPAPLTSAGVTIESVKARLDERLNRELESGVVNIEVDPRGLVVSVREAGSFAVGSAELSAIAVGLLETVADALSGVGNLVRVEGHTDDVPIHTERYRSNWELSTARATTVVAFLIGHGLAPSRLSAAGYAEFHPRVANDSASGRARNRRIDIVVLNPLTSRREEPGQPPAQGAAR